MVGADTARRAVQIVIGLVLAFYGNYMPKETVRCRPSSRAAARWQSALRVGGWSMTLAGLGHAAVWAFAPVPFADVAAMVLVAAATVVTMAYCGWTLLDQRALRATPPREYK